MQSGWANSRPEPRAILAMLREEWGVVESGFGLAGSKMGELYKESARRGNGRKWKFWIVCCALFRFPEDEGSEVWRFFVLSCCGL